MKLDENGNYVLYLNYGNIEYYKFFKIYLKKWEDKLATLLIVSEATLVEGAGPVDAVAGEEHGDMKAVVAASAYEKCERCWKHDKTVGTDADHKTLCHRCVSSLE